MGPNINANTNRRCFNLEHFAAGSVFLGLLSLFGAALEFIGHCFRFGRLTYGYGQIPACCRCMLSLPSLAAHAHTTPLPRSHEWAPRCTTRIKLEGRGHLNAASAYDACCLPPLLLLCFSTVNRTTTDHFRTTASF